MKNQISIEYLSTFGWILLVVLVTILALSYFGIFDISNQIPEKCNFGEQITCNNQFIDDNGNFVLSLTSGYNRQVEITAFNSTNYLINNCTSTVLIPGQETNIICDISDSYGSPIIFDDNRQSLDLILTIQPIDSTDTYQVEGNIFTDIISGDVSVAFNCEDLGGDQVCNSDYQCFGSVLSSSEYLGEGFCCVGQCIENYCEGEDPPAQNGTCCNACLGSPISGSQYRLACEEAYGAGKQCCNTCKGGKDDGGPGIGTGDEGGGGGLEN